MQNNFFMKYYSLLFVISLSNLLLSQMNTCPISNGKIINGYFNNENEQTYNGIFFKDKPSILPVDVTVITDKEDENIFSLVKGEVFFVNENTIAIRYQNNRILIYNLLKNISAKKGDIIEEGMVVGKVELNKFPPKKYKDILHYKDNIYSVNLSFHYINFEIGKLIHSPNEFKIISCDTIICEKCQPIIHGILN